MQSANALLPSSFFKKIQEKKKLGSMTIENEFGLLRRKWLLASKPEIQPLMVLSVEQTCCTSMKATISTSLLKVLRIKRATRSTNLVACECPVAMVKITSTFGLV
jgi:hypothetical protein